MENPSLRLERYGGSTSRTFTVKDLIEDESGQWATDEVTGKKGYIDDEKMFFGRGTTTRTLGGPDHSRPAK